MFYKVNDSLYESYKKSKLNIVLNVLIFIIIVALFFEIIFATAYSGIYVVGPSMNDTLTGAEDENSSGGDYVYVRRGAVPDYGDIVVVFKNSDITIIKRVIALGGDRVKLEKGVLKIKYKGANDFVTVPEPYVSRENNNPALSKNNFYSGTDGFYVTEGTMFLLGDNRNVSEDSRALNGNSYGKLFPVTSLYGVVTDWSLNNLKFFTSLHKYFSFDLPRYFGLA